jgi:hypothetical protein
MGVDVDVVKTTQADRGRQQIKQSCPVLWGHVTCSKSDATLCQRSSTFALAITALLGSVRDPAPYSEFEFWYQTSLLMCPRAFGRRQNLQLHRTKPGTMTSRTVFQKGVAYHLQFLEAVRAMLCFYSLERLFQVYQWRTTHHSFRTSLLSSLDLSSLILDHPSLPTQVWSRLPLPRREGWLIFNLRPCAYMVYF